MIRPNTNVLISDVAGESVLLNMDTEKYFTLNESGTRMWEALQQHGTLDGAVAALLEEYDVEEATLRQDLTTLIEELRAAQLVIVEEA
ncbi:MAG TPA: PqqD family protein [Aggregatilineales bacterium]|nr:PqqD family protein [Anaerolineales bacterium]HRE48046.1 PqqD family protein [Aggregatilineales bacterium]